MEVNSNFPGYSNSRTSMISLFFLQVLCDASFCNGALLGTMNQQAEFSGMRKGGTPSNFASPQMNQLSPDQLAPSQRNLEIPFTNQPHNGSPGEVYSKDVSNPVEEEKGCDNVSKNSFLKNFFSKSLMEFTRADDFDGDHSNMVAHRKLPGMNQLSHMYYQSSKPGQLPVQIVYYVNPKNGLGNYYIHRGKRGQSAQKYYSQQAARFGKAKKTCENEIKKQGSSEECVSTRNNTTFSDTLSQNLDLIKQEDLSLIVNTLSPIYDWSNQKHRDVSEIDRYQCLIELIENLKCRVAEEKENYMKTLASPSEKNSDQSEKNDLRKQILLGGDTFDKLVGGCSNEQESSKDIGENPSICSLDPTECDSFEDPTTCLKVKRQSPYSRCDCGYFNRREGHCPCASWGNNQRRYSRS